MFMPGPLGRDALFSAGRGQPHSQGTVWAPEFPLVMALLWVGAFWRAELHADVFLASLPQNKRVHLHSPGIHPTFKQQLAPPVVLAVQGSILIGRTAINDKSCCAISILAKMLATHLDRSEVSS